MKIVQSPNPVLSQVAKPVEKVDKAIKQLLADMETTLIEQVDPEGVGLAAPQVGKSLQIFIVRQDPEAEVLTFINPVIKKTFKKPEEKAVKETKGKKKKEEKGVQLEGCLSLKDIWGVVKRSDGVVLAYQDEHGKAHERTFDGFLATIIQHEVDHLHGVLFPKRVLEQKNPLYHSSKTKKGEIEFEEIEI